MIEIPRFSQSEYFEIKPLLEEAGIPFEDKALQESMHPLSGGPEYFFYVAREHFNETISIIKKYYSIGLHKEKYTGHCPACNFEVKSSVVCPDCGLNLSSDKTEAFNYYPFVIFLRQNYLL